MTDNQIYDLLREDYDKGFQALFDKYYKSLVIYSCGMTGALNASEDIVQTVFYKYLRDRKFDRIDVGKLKSYLFTAVKNTTFNHLNNRKITYSIDNYQGGITLPEEEKLYDDVLIAEIKSHVEKLPPRTRQIVEDIMLSDMRYKEVAEKYGISVNTVKILLGRGLKRLRSEMGPKIYMLFLLLLNH